MIEVIDNTLELSFGWGKKLVIDCASKPPNYFPPYHAIISDNGALFGYIDENDLKKIYEFLKEKYE